MFLGGCSLMFGTSPRTVSSANSCAIFLLLTWLALCPGSAGAARGKPQESRKTDLGPYFF